MRQRPVRSGGSGGSGRTDRTMWVVRSDEDGDGRTKMGTNPDRIQEWDEDEDDPIAAIGGQFTHVDAMRVCIP